MTRGVGIVANIVTGCACLLILNAMADIIGPWIPESSAVEMGMFYSGLSLLPAVFLAGVVSLFVLAIAQIRGQI